MAVHMLSLDLEGLYLFFSLFLASQLHILHVVLGWSIVTLTIFWSKTLPPLCKDFNVDPSLLWTTLGSSRLRELVNFFFG